MKKLDSFHWIVLLILGVYLSSCSTNPQPIDYGSDACHFCQMTIVDKIHGAELVSDKGKIFKFDAAECLIRHKNKVESIEGYQLLTNYFESPMELFPMKDGTFLISENLPSPMGAFLTVFKTKEAAIRLQKEKGGKLYSWVELDKHLK